MRWRVPFDKQSRDLRDQYRQTPRTPGAGKNGVAQKNAGGRSKRKGSPDKRQPPIGFKRHPALRKPGRKLRRPFSGGLHRPDQGH